MTPTRLILAALLGLSACTREAPAPEEPPALVDKDGRCYSRDITPARFETVTEQVLVQPAELHSDGRVITPAVYRSVTEHRIVSERREVEFETLCEADLTPEFVTSLQRALQARGYFRGAVDGQMSRRLGRAIQAYQKDFGPDSPLLSFDAAQRLGLRNLRRDQIDALDDAPLRARPGG